MQEMEGRVLLDQLFSQRSEHSLELPLLDDLAEAGVLAREMKRQWFEQEAKAIEDWLRDANSLAENIAGWCPKGWTEDTILKSTEEAQVMQKALFENPNYSALSGARSHLEQMTENLQMLNTASHKAIPCEQIKSLQDTIDHGCYVVTCTFACYALLVEIPAKSTDAMRDAEAEKLKKDLTELNSQIPVFINAAINKILNKDE